MSQAKDPGFRPPARVGRDDDRSGAASPSAFRTIVERSKRKGIGLRQLVEQCLQSASVDLDPPFYEMDALDERRLEAATDAGRYELAFQIGCGDNPFLTYADEVGLYFLLVLRSDRLAVELHEESGDEELARDEARLDGDETLLEVGARFGAILDSPRIQAPLRRYLDRWELLRLTEDEVRSAATRLFRVFGGDDPAPLLEFEGGRPWRTWIEALAGDPDWEETALRISDLGAPEADVATVEAAVRLAERSERDLRFALETSLLAVGRRDGRRLQTGAARAQRASLPFRALAAPDERLPAILEARVHLLIDRMSRTLPGTSAGDGAATGAGAGTGTGTGTGTAAAGDTDASSPAAGGAAAGAIAAGPRDWLASRLAEIGDKAGWAPAGVRRVRAAFVENEVTVDEEALDVFEYLVGKYDASPRFVECMLEVRRWCESEGYGQRYEDLDPETHVYAPPSLEAMFRFVHHFAELPESEEAIATLDDWIRQRFVDPRDFENDLFRHLRLIAYADPDDAS